MTDLARVAGCTGNDLAALDHAAADAGADKCGDHVAIAASGSEAKLGGAGDPDVVAHKHRAAERDAQLRPQRKISHVHIGAEEDGAGLAVERAGRSHTGAQYLVAR